MCCSRAASLRRTLDRGQLIPDYRLVTALAEDHEGLQRQWFRVGAALFVMIVGTLSVLGMVVVAADHAFWQAKDPDAFAVAQCGGALGGNPPGSPDTNDCYSGLVTQSPFQVARPWLIASVAVVIVGGGLTIALLRPQRPG
jgi:hypothetical protein